MKRKYVLLIDDTGFNHDDSQDEFVRQEKNTFCALLVPEEKFQRISDNMKMLCDVLNTKYAQSEFHFCEMYSKTGSFKNMKDEELLDIIEIFSEYLKIEEIEVITQTVTDFTFKDCPELKKALVEEILRPSQIKVSDKSLDLVLTVLMSKKRVEKELGGEISSIFCDEGIRKANTNLILPIGENKYTINFKKSSETPAIQLADFCAWILSRQKQILQKNPEKLSSKEIEILQIFSEIAPNYVNLKTCKTTTDNAKADAVSVLRKDRKEKGLEPIK